MAALVTSCDSPTRPPTEGVLVPRVVFARDTTGQFRVLVPLDAVRVYVYGPGAGSTTLATTVSLVKQGTEWRGTAAGLEPGIYRLQVEGVVGTVTQQLQNFGVSNSITVIAGSAGTPATVVVVPIVPALPPLAVSTVAYTASIVFPTIPNASLYNVEVSQSSTFAPPVYATNSATSTVVATLNATGLWYYRGRPSFTNVSTQAIWSDAQSFTVAAAAGGRTAGTANTTTPVVGTTSSVADRNITGAGAGIEDWFTLPNLRAGDSLFLDAVANGLTPASPLNSAITLYRQNQTTPVGAVESSGGTGTDARLIRVLPGTETYYAKVTAEAGSVGHFEFRYLVKRLPAAPTGFTAVAASNTSVQLNWTDNANTTNGDQETSYRVERCTGGAGCASFAEITATAPNATSYLDNTGLTAGLTYTYNVFARNASGDSPKAGALTVALVGPAAPGSLTATTIAGTQINLLWSDLSNNETGFRIEGCANAACPTMSLITNVSAGTTSYSHTVSVDGTYTYEVKAFNNIGTSAGSGTATANTIRPAMPTGPSATTISATQIDLGWSDGSNNESGFRVERCTGLGCASGFTLLTTTSAGVQAYSDLTVAPATYYGYRIAATNVAGLSAYTAVVYANTRTPGAPASFAASIFSATRVNLSWVDTSAAETGFVVERCVNVACSGFGLLVSLAPGTTSHSDNTVTQGNTYRYRVRATGVAGNSPDAGPVDVSVLLPTAPASLTATTISSTQVNLAWVDLSDNETTFRIERCSGPACSFVPITSEIANVTAGTAAYSDVGVTEGNDYSYRVRALNAVGYSASYTNVSSTSTALAAAPTALTATTTSTSNIDLAWVDNAGNETGYRVERCANAACPTFSLLTTLPADVEAFSNTVSAGNSYTYRVYAYNLAGNSPFSNTATATTAVPITPSGLAATAMSSTSIQISWNDIVNDESGFTIFRCQGAGCTPTVPYDVAPQDAESYLDAGASADQSYSYRVSAFNVIGTSGLSNVASATTSVPGPLVGLTAITISATRIDISWTDTTTNATGIAVQRCQGAGCTNFTDFTAAATGSQTLNDATVLVDQQYRYRVYAVNNVGDGGFSEVDGNTLRPFTPTNIVATTNSPTQVTVSWDNNADNELGYYVSRCVGVGCTNFNLVSTLPVDATAYVDTDVAADNIYRYRVVGYNIAGSSDLPVPVTASTFVPPAPTGLTATTQSDSRIDLAWTDNASDEVGYLIERCEGSGCSSFTQVDSVGTNVQAYQNTGLNPNSEFTFRVRAVNTSGPSNYSNSASAATNLPGAPSFLSATVLSATSVQLDWVDNAAFPNAELGFRLERCEGAGCSNYAEFNVIGADLQQYVDGGLGAGLIYRYRLRAYNNVGASGYSNEVSITTAVPTAPSVLLAFGSSPTTVGLQWSDDSDNETSFVIERCTGAACTSFLVVGTVAVADSTGFLSTGLTAETNYRFRIRAVNAVGPSAYSPIADANTKLPPAPSALNASATLSTVVSMTWTDNATDEVSYSVERCQGAACSSFAQIAVLPLNSTGYTNVGLTPNSVYRFRVRAINPVGPGPYSNIDDAPTDIPIEPDTLTALAMASTEIDLSWVDASNNETGFIIERCSGVSCGNFTILQLVGANVNSYADPSVDPDQSYSYRVQAVKTGVGASGFSNVASAVTSVPGGPVNLFASTISGSRIDLSWDDNATNELGLEVERCIGVGCNNFTLLSPLAANTMSYSDQGVGLNLTIRYRVRATNNVGPSSFSNEATSNTLQPQLTSGLSATTVSGSQIDLQWVDASTNETYFLLERCVGAGCSDFVRIDSLGVGTTTFQDVSVAVGNVYRYRVAAFNNSGTAGYDGPSEATTLLPADPAAMTASVITSSRIDLTWTDLSDNEDGFRVERCSGIGCSSFVEIVALPAGTTAYSNTGLTINTFYTYRVRAFNAAGTSAYATPIDANTFFPAAPNALTATTIYADQVNLVWNDNSNNETSFQVERCTGAGCTAFANIGTVGTDVEAYSDLTTAIGQTYRYRVRAVNGVGNSGFTLIATALTTGVPATPSGLTAVTTSASTIQLNWTDNSNNELRFRIERCQGASCAIVAAYDSVGAGVTTYTDVGLPAMTSFSYRVRAVNVGASAPSNAATATTILPNAPTLLAAIGVSGTRADLSWTDNADNEYGYRIERCTGAGCSTFTEITTVGAGVTAYADNALSADNTYVYRIRAYNGAGVSGYSNEASAITNVPAIPTGLTATTISASQIDLAWTDIATTETEYQIERCSGVGCTNFASIATVAVNAQVYSNTGLTAGLIFRYRVRAANLSGPSGYSNTATAGTNVPADPTSLVALTIANFQVDLTWNDNADNELGYVVERCDAVACSNFVQVASLSVNATAYSDNTLSIGNDYRFRVRADNNAGSSNYSNIAAGSTRTPLAPTNLTATTESSTQIDLAWTDNSDNELTFRVRRCSGPACFPGDQIAQLPPNTTTYSDIGLAPNTSYTYVIEANNVSGWSGTSSQETATTNFPATPSNLTATTISATRIDLAWTDASNNESGFRVYRCDNAGCGTETYVLLFTTGVNAVSLSDLSATIGNEYGYRVEAFNVAGTSPFVQASATTLLPAVPTAQDLIFVDNTLPTVLLTWTDNANNEAAYLIERCAGVGCTTFVQISTTGPDLGDVQDINVPTGDVLRYRVRASNAAGQSDYSGILELLITVPAAASGLSATTLSESQISLGWTDNASNEQGYRVEICSGPACADFVEIQIVGANEQTFGVTGLTIGTVYRFRVRPFNTIGDGGNSNETEANTFLPNDPASLAATTVAPGQIDLVWTDNANNEQSYRVERCSGLACSSFVEIATLGPNANAYSNTGVSLNGVYRYRVRALNVIGASAYTNEDQANTLLPTAPTALVATSVTGSRIDLSWNDSNFEAGYQIEACTGVGCTDFVVVRSTAANNTSVQLDSITFGREFNFRVRGQNISGPSPYSNEASGSTVLVGPSNVRATTTGRNAINIIWSDNSDIETAYVLERCFGAGCVSYVPIAGLAPNTTSFPNTGIPGGVFVNYRVRAVTDGGQTFGEFGASAMTPIPVGSPFNSPAVSDSSQSERHWVINVPPGSRQLVVKQSAGSGDPDLYLKYGAVPVAYDPINDSQNCVPYTGANPEYCVINDPTPGDWFVMSQGYSPYTDMSLEVSVPGDVVFINDINLFYNYMTLAYPQNQQLARNLVQFTGMGVRSFQSTVYVDRGRSSPATSILLPDFQAVLNAAGYGVGNINSASGTLTAGLVPLGVKVLVMWVPVTAYTPAEIDFLRLFVKQGGRIVYVGEWYGFFTPTGIATMNQFLAAFGSPSTYKNDATYTAGWSRGAADQITTGVLAIVEGSGGPMIVGGNDKVIGLDGAGVVPWWVVLRPTWQW